MKLKFVKAHRSIKKLNDIEISDFAVITGLNGTGKTHLLHAIEDESITIEGIPSSEIVYYNYNDFNVDYNQQPKTTGKSDQQLPVKKYVSKNGNSIVQRVINERIQILNAVEFVRNTELDNLIENVLNSGHQLSVLHWNQDEIKNFKEFLQLTPDGDNYSQMFQSLPEKVKLIHDMYGYFIPSVKILLDNFEINLINYFNKLMIRKMGFNRNFLAWSELDAKKYEELKTQNPQFNIWEYEGVFSHNFLDFISVYQEHAARFDGYIYEDLSTLKSNLITIFDKLEVVLKEKLMPEHLRFIKSFSIDNSLFSLLQAESGALDLTQIANEEKQYQINKNQNDYNGYLKKEKGAITTYLSDEEFMKIYGNSPISLLNDALDKYDCNGYEFRSTEIPNQWGFDAQQHNISISLYHKHKQYPTDLESLSSGEKTLLALTFYIYKLQYKRKVVASLLLLDEIDSSLHPSMSKRLINVLHDLFYKELNIKIILSTHSPSTVAFAPDNSLYVMKGEGDDRLYASNKDIALEELTIGVPSFSINYENRRQVFVESKYDVEYYEKLYQIFKKQLNSEISLNFIASGDIQRDKNGQPKSNCDQVIEITKLLRTSGNKFIWGIIDWDAKTKKPESEYVKVLGWEERYSIENFLLDPLLVSVLLMAEKIKKPDFFGLKEDLKVYEILNQNEEDLQKIINALLKEVNNELQIDLNDKINYTTIGGIELVLPRGFVEYQGHNLEEKYLKAFPELNKLKRNDEKALKMEVLNKVIEEFPKLVPLGLLEILKEVQQV